MPQFKYYWLFDALQNREYDLVISNEIISEYEEKIIEKFGLELAEARLEFLLLLPNVEWVNPYYNWNLISEDPDDNKFVDGAVSGNVDYLVTNDRHFRVLKDVKFPPIHVVTLEEFEKILRKEGP